VNKFEEYKLFVEDTAKFSERRQTINNTYIAINSIILTATSFLVKDAGFIPVWRAIVAAMILSAGITLCAQWERMIRKYKRLVGFRINQLLLIEASEEMKSCHGMYHAEKELYPTDEKNNSIPGQGLNFSDGEKWLPRVFGAVYVIFLLGTLFVLFFAPHLLSVPQAAK
jgi:hypothetical protein